MSDLRAGASLPPLAGSGVTANPLLLAAACVPVVASVLLLPASSIGIHQVGLALAAAGVAALLLFKQYVAKLSGSIDYERVPWLDHSMVVAFVVALALVLAHAHPWATQLATEACACG